MREHTDPFFAGAEPLWRLSLPSTAPPLELDGRQLIEWNGGLRWLKSRDAGERGARRARSACSGHATLFRADDKAAGCFAPLEPGRSSACTAQLKAAFDPAGILNPGRMYRSSRA